MHTFFPFFRFYFSTSHKSDYLEGGHICNSLIISTWHLHNMSVGSSGSGLGAGGEELLSILLANRVEHATGHYDDRFWPRSVLAACLTRPRVQRALVLEGYPERVSTDLAGRICHDGSGGKRPYLRLFAILVLCEKISETQSFLSTQDGICDDSLPLRPVEVGHNMNLKLVRREDQDQAPTPACLQKWQRLELESFLKMQRHVSPHVFRRDPRTVVRHEKLDANQILPWVNPGPGDEIGRDTKEPGQGAYSTVYYHKVHPSCHEFSSLLREVSPPPDSRTSECWASLLIDASAEPPRYIPRCQDAP